jgi:hypothetical protein
MTTLRSNNYIIVLPSAKWSDEQGVNLRVRLKYNMLEVLHTVVRRPSYDKRVLSFELTRHNALNLLRFITNTAGTLIYLEDHNGDMWYGNILNDPAVMNIEGRGNGSDTRKERVSFELIFEGNKL